MEVKRTPEESPLIECEQDKRMWIKVDDIDDELYQQNYAPTQYHTDIKILSTEQYVPDFLKKLCVENTGNYSHELHIKLFILKIFLILTLVHFFNHA